MFEEIFRPKAGIIIPPILCCCSCKCYTNDPSKNDTSEDYNGEGIFIPT